MADGKQARMLLQAAERDFLALGGMIRDEAEEFFADEVFGFHAQQAAEKLIKAWLCILDESYPLTHNLTALLDILEARGVATERLRPLTEYTVYAGGVRYGGDEPNAMRLAPLDRALALRRVTDLFEQVRRLMPPDG